MDTERLKKARNYALVILGVGAGQLSSNAYFGRTRDELLYTAMAFFLVSIIVLVTSYSFLGWWAAKKQHLGSAEPLPILLSPILWLPALVVFVYIVMSIFNA
jgi:hypothetical protein